MWVNYLDLSVIVPVAYDIKALANMIVPDVPYLQIFILDLTELSLSLVRLKIFNQEILMQVWEKEHLTISRYIDPEIIGIFIVDVVDDVSVFLITFTFTAMRMRMRMSINIM